MDLRETMFVYINNNTGKYLVHVELYSRSGSLFHEKLLLSDPLPEDKNSYLVSHYFKKNSYLVEVIVYFPKRCILLIQK